MSQQATKTQIKTIKAATKFAKDEFYKETV
jgi:hypothetical protein